MMEAVKALILIALLPPALIAGPVNFSWQDGRYNDASNSQCSSTCTEASKFGYEVGKTYRYAYEVTGISSIPGASDDSSTVFASANAHVHVISKCEMAMTLSDVVFKTSDPGSSTLRDVGDYQYTSLLEENPLYFSFQDGRVEEVCPSSADDNKEVLNFKRGVLSAFQNSMSRHQGDQSLRELDVSGNCPTQYSVTQIGWKSTQITKTKDLLGCTERQHYRTSLQSTPFHVPDAIQSLPLLKGDLKCSLTLSKTGVLSTVSCVEALIFRPFSRKESGAKTETTQKLEFMDSQPTYDLSRASISRKTSLAFEHVQKGDNEDEEIWAVRDKLEKMCKLSSQGISKQVPGLFSETVYLMKELPFNALNDLWSGINTGLISSDYKEVARQFFLDALPMVGTEHSVKIMVNLLLSEEVTGVRSSLWLKSFAFLQHTNKDMIRDSLRRLLTSEKLRLDSLLSVTSAIHNYCLEQEDCQAQREVSDVVATLDDILGRDCRSTDTTLILTTLRAVGNLGFSDNLVSTLENCIEMSENSMNVRVTAVQAFRGVTCNAQRSSLLDVYMSKGEDSELRINAYLGLMMCPTHSILQKVKETLESEEINQVGSFVWTHLTNLAETSNPHKQDLKAILQDEKLKSEFDMDKRKYSRNYEMSYFSERFGTGATGESNLIWSSSSFLPRSVMLNLTVDVLGHSMNLFEVGGRVQGLQQLLHDYLGNKLKDFNDGKSKNPSRCVRQGKMDDMKEKHAVNDEDLTASMYLRMFGNELEYTHFTKEDIMALKNKFNAKDMMGSLAKGQDISVTHSAMFLDSTVTVPTIAGMGLQLSVNGTASVQLKASGKMDMRRLSMKRMQIHFDLQPSGAIQIGGEMALNAGIMKSGLKMATTLHSSTAFTGKLDWTNGQVFSLTADTPRDKMEIFDMQSEFFIIHTNAVRPQKMLEERAAIQQKGCSDKIWLKVLGYELCGDVSYVNATMIHDAPYFPLTGPLSGSLVLHKRDAPQGFKLMAEKIDNRDSFLGRLSIDTPASKEERKLATSYFVDTKAHSIELEAVSPWNDLIIKGSYNSDPKSYKVSGSVIIDQKPYELTFKVDKDVQGKKVVWTPNLQITRPKGPSLIAFAPETVGVSGSISISKKMDDIAADIDILTNLKPSPIKIQANYVNKKAQKTVSWAVILNKKETYSATFQVLETYFGKNTNPSKLKPTILISAPDWRPFLLSGSIDFKKDKLFKTNVQVIMEKTLKNPVVLNLKLLKAKSKFKGSGKLTSQFGTIKSKGFIDVPSKTKKKGPMLMTKIITSYNFPVVRDRSLRKNTVTFSSKLHDRSSKSLLKYDANVVFESRNYQKATFVAGASFSHKETSTKVVLTYKGGEKAKNLKDKSKELKIETSLDHKLQEKDALIKYDVQVLYPIKAIEWQINGKHEHHLKKKISIETYTSFIYAKGKSSEFRLKIDDNSRKFILYNGLMEFRYPDFRFDGNKINGRSYKVVSTLEQTPDKEYTQSVRITINKKMVHTMYTKVKYMKNTDYELNSQINVGSDENTKVTILSSHVDNKRDLSVKVNKDGKIYQGETSMTFDMKEYGGSFDMSWPERRVKSSVEFANKQKGEYMMKFLTLWDADNDMSKKIDGHFTYIQQNKPKLSKYVWDMSLTTPFESCKMFAYKRLIELTPKSKKDEFKIVWLQPEDELSYKFWILNPVTLERFQMDFEVVTPFKELRMGRTEIRHKYAGPNYLETAIKSKYNENDMSFDILVSTRKNKVTNKQECKLELGVVGVKRDSLEFHIGDFDNHFSSSPLSPGWPKSLKMKLNHDNDGRIYNSLVSLDKDDKESMIKHHATYSRAGKMINVKSSVDVVLDDVLSHPIHIELVHANTLTNLNTTLSSTWGNNQRASVDVGATVLKHDQSLYIHYSGTFKDVHDYIYKHHHSSLNGWSGSVFQQINKDPRAQSGSTYKITKTEMSYESFAPTQKWIMKSEYENYPYTAYMKYSFLEPSDRNWQHVVFDGSVIKNKDNDWTSDVRLVTPFDEVKNVDVKGNLKDVGKNEWSLDGDISFDVRKEIKLKFFVDAEKWSKIEAEVENPWKDVAFTITNKKQRKSVKTEVKVKYDEDKEITANFNGKLRFPEKSMFSLELATPYSEFRSANVRGLLQNTGNKWNGYVNTKYSSNNPGFFNVNFGNEEREGFLDYNVEMTSSEFDKVEHRFMMDIGDQLSAAEVKLVAPEIGRNVLGFKVNSKSWLDFQEKIYGEIRGHALDMDVGLKHEEVQTNAWLTFSYPGADKSFVKTSMHRIGDSLNDFDVGGYLQIGKNSKPYNASAQFSNIEDKTALGTTFTSPFTDPFSFLLKHQMTQTGQVRTVYGRYDDTYMIDIYDMYDLTDSKYVNTRRTGYLFGGKGHTSGYDLSAEWSDDGEEFSLKSNMDDDEITINGEHVPQAANVDNQDTLDVYLTTPYENFRDLELHTVFEKKDKYHVEIDLEYMDDKEAELKVDVKKTRNKITANGELSLPIKGYEKNSISYTHVAKRNMFNAEAEVTTGQGENLKANIEYKNKEEFIFNLVGPFKEFQSMKIAGKYNEQEQRLNGDMQLQISPNPRPLTLEYDIHINSEPVVMTFKLRSPYENFKRADLTINHSGKQWDKFTTSSTLTSEKLGRINFNANMDFHTPRSMELKATLTSSLKNMENLKLSLKTSNEHKNHVKTDFEVGWSIDKEIIVQTSFNEDNSAQPRTMTTTFDMTTPFEEVKVVKMKLSESIGYKNQRRSVFVRHNERTYLDADFKTKIDRIDVIDVSLDMRNPRPMSINVEGKLVDKTFDGKVFLNWDKHKPESQFEFNVHMADKSDDSNIDTDFSFKVIHPVRIMAVEYLLRKANNEVQTSGLITWDESKGNTFSYDLGYTDRSSKYSDMYNGHIKFGVPQRSVKLEGSYGDTGSTRTMTGTALWDADRDEKKKVTLSTTHEYAERMERLSLNLNLPSINKQLNVGTSLKRGYGSSILDSKTEISYSSDSRKTIYITNKIYNNVLDQEGRGDYNYTMETGFKHSVTDTDLQWLSHLGQVNKVVSVGNQFTYKTIDRQHKVFAWRIQADQDKSGEITITTPLKTVNIVGKQFVRRGRPSCSVELLEDGIKTLAFSGKLLPRTKQFEVSLNYDRDDPMKTMYMNGAYVTDRSAEMSVFDNDNVYMKMNVKMNNSHVIHSKINWMPTLPKDIQVFFGTKLAAFSYTAKEIWDSTVKNVGTEVKAKYLRVSQELRDEIGQVFELMRKEMEIFNVQLETLRTQIRRIYNRNDLHLRDLGVQLEEALQEILSVIQDLVKNYRSYYNEVSKATNEWINYLKNYPISLMYGKTVNDMMEKMKEIRLVLEEVLKEVVLECKEAAEIVYKKYKTFSRDMDRKLNSYIQSQHKLAIFKQMMKEKERMARLGADYKAQELEAFDEVFIQTQQVLEDQFHDLMSRFEFQQLHAMGTEIYQQMKYWNAERGLSHAVTRLLDLSKNLILIELGKMKNILMDIKKSHVTVYDPIRGELQFEIHVPFEMKSFSEPPDFKIGRYAKDAYTWVENRFMPIKNSSLWDLYDVYVPSLRTSEWIPPFEATGYVIGSQNIITFDNTNVDFLSSCSHVLVRDMLGDSFSVILNYDRNPVRNGIKSICFSFGNSLSLEVSKDYQLSVNGQETEMPFENEVVRIVRDGNTISVRYVNGLEVVTNPSLDLHKVTLSGWFHGRTAGLLGFYDNEKQNEASMTDRLYEFEVNRRSCSNKNVAVRPDPNMDIGQGCSSLFEDKSSQFKSCFKEVDPSAFMKMCLVSMSNMEQEKAIVKTAEQYRSVCRDKGFFMPPVKGYPSVACGNVEFPDRDEALKESADVVFVVEDAKCNKWASSSLTNIVTEMNNALNKNGIFNNRFGLVGFNGEDVTVSTIHGKHFGQDNSFLKAVETLRLEKTSEPGDLVAAVRMAMRYPFRIGVPVKMMVVVPCTSCQVSILESNLDSELKDAGFTVHILQEQGFSLPEHRSKSSFRIYGMDNMNVISNRGPSLLEPSSVTLRYNDYCAEMASTTLGSLFDTTHLKHSKGRIQKEFIKTFANEVGRSVTIPVCQECQCNADSGNVQCTMCATDSLSMNEIPSDSDSQVVYYTPLAQK